MYKTPNKEKIEIMGTLVPIIVSSWKCNAEDCDGLYDCGKIYLRDEYESENEYKRIIIHECIHALCEILGCQLDHHMEETLAHTISSMIAKHFT